MPFIGPSAGGVTLTSRRRAWGAALGGYLGLTAAAFVTAVEFGIQPALFHAADGAPLYAPYPLSVAIPAMVLPHLAVASVVEGPADCPGGRLTCRVPTPPSLAAGESGDRLVPQIAHYLPRGSSRLWLVLVVLVLASPLGLLAPGTAWGEWSSAQLAGHGHRLRAAWPGRVGGPLGRPSAGL